VISGTGGQSQQSPSASASPQADVAFEAFGYLKMVLHPTSYDGSFVKYDGTVLDTFSGTCNSATPSPTPSATPAPLPTATPTPTPIATPSPTPTPAPTSISVSPSSLNFGKQAAETISLPQTVTLTNNEA